MAIETLKKLWKNDYFQTAITIALIFLIVFSLYYSAQAVLGTPYPVLAVASGSMLPTLNIGDLIVVQKIDPAQINADPKGLTGDILVYKKGDELIVHRAVKIEDRNGIYYITTRGDNSGVDDPAWPSTNLVGKVIARIPYLGNIPLFLNSGRNTYILFLALLIIFIILMLPFGSNDKEKLVEKKSASKIDLGIYYAVLNIVIIGLIIFSLYGSFTFWQPGAAPPNATIRGMYADQQYHESFNVKAILHQSLLTYKIDCEMSSGTRLGVPTFAWYQFFTIILIIFNVWKIHSFLKSRKRCRL
ncbi:MAG: signal peptidase I [Candidatus Bathyarchaeia archaeon]